MSILVTFKNDSEVYSPNAQMHVTGLLHNVDSAPGWR